MSEKKKKILSFWWMFMFCICWKTKGAKKNFRLSVCLSVCLYVRTWTFHVDTITFEGVRGSKQNLLGGFYVWNVGLVLSSIYFIVYPFGFLNFFPIKCILSYFYDHLSHFSYFQFHIFQTFHTSNFLNILYFSNFHSSNFLDNFPFSIFQIFILPIIPDNFQVYISHISHVSNFPNIFPFHIFLSSNFLDIFLFSFNKFPYF